MFKSCESFNIRCTVYGTALMFKTVKRAVNINYCLCGQFMCKTVKGAVNINYWWTLTYV